MGSPNWRNRTLFHGDNLGFLRGMNSESVHLIATDPPFNKNRDFHATPDSLASGASFQDRWSWEKDVHQDWVDKITDDFPKVMNVVQGSRNSYGDDMGAFLCFMAVRLLEMRRVLSGAGSIYLHCDPTASHYLKELMDAIFGRRNFRNEVIWHYRSFHGNVKTYFPKKHDSLLLYSKSGDWTFHRLFEESNEHTMDFQRWKSCLVDGRKILGRNMPVQDTRFLRFLRRWIREHGRQPGPDDVVYEVAGQALDTVWDIKPVDPKDKRERVGYPTQKPLALYERIVKASSNEGDVVFDPFCGCATTLIAAERLGRRWVGIDVWNKAHETVIKRLKGERLSGPDGDTGGNLLVEGRITYSREVPERTDDGDEAVPFLRTKLKVDEPKDRKMSRAEMLEFLLDQNGSRCQGCDRVFDDSRYLELDHNTPRSDGGLNHISNRILLCGPCNKLKGNRFTLTGLRRENTKLGYMAG